MAQKKAFLLRIAPEVLEALEKWADDELRSLNGQIEFILRRALTERGRLKEKQNAGQDRVEPPPAQGPAIE